MARPLHALCLLTVLLGACTDAPELARVAPPRPVEASGPSPTRGRGEPEAPSPEPSHPPLVDGAHGNWTPDTRLLEIALRLGPAANREQVDAELSALPPNDRISVLRAGLRLADVDAARAAAARLEWAEVDGWESARVVGLLAQEAFAEETESDFEEFRSIAGSDELPLVLENLPPLPWGVDPVVLSNFHRQMRAEHIPMYARLAREAPPSVANVMRSDLWLLAQYSDRFRDEIARMYLGEHADGLPASGSGFPPLLAACVRRFFVDGYVDGDTHSHAAWIANWALRWLNDSTPTDADAALLVECARADNGRRHDTHFAHWSLLSALGKLDEPASRTFLEERVEHEDDAAVAALARRGDSAALAVLRASFDTYLALLLEIDPHRTIEELTTAAFAESGSASIDIVASLRDAQRQRQIYGYSWSAGLFEGMEAKALAADARPAALVAIAISWPGCRTRRMAAEAVRRMDTDVALRGFLTDLDGNGALSAHFEPAAAFLEVGAPDAWRGRLRRAAPRGPGFVAESARTLLLLMGDPPSGDLLFPCWLESDDEVAAILRSPSDALEAHLRERAASERGEDADEALAALAALYGLPLPRGDREPLIYVTLSGSDERDVSDEDYESIRALVLDRKPFEALELLLTAHPYGVHDGVGRVKREFVRTYLNGVRARRDLRLYPWATGELAVWGDPDAIAEQRDAIRIGRYRWMSDQAEPYHLLLGGPAGVEFMVSEQETNCCRVVMGSGNALEAYYGIDDLDVGYSTPTRLTLFEAVRSYFDEAGGDWTWSHVAGHYVPTPR